MFCRQCGADLGSDVKFCQKCGVSAEATPEKPEREEKGDGSSVKESSESTAGKEMSPFGYFISGWKKATQFSGRANRSEFWWFVLFSFLVGIGVSIVDGAVGVGGAQGIGVISGLYGIASILPSLALAIRRLHDTNRSGWWLLIGLLPLIGPVVLIYFYVLESHSGKTEFE